MNNSIPKKRKYIKLQEYDDNIIMVENAWCHQCKTKAHQVFICNNMKRINYVGHGIRCRIKYCEKCIRKHYMINTEELKAANNWKCPICLNICKCVACRRKRGEIVLKRARKSYKTKSCPIADTHYTNIPQLLNPPIQYNILPSFAELEQSIATNETENLTLVAWI